MVNTKADLVSTQTTGPRSMPSHNRPRRSSRSARTTRLGTPVMLAGENSRNLAPSNLTSPPSVPTHKYPSGVCAMPETLFSGNPSSDCQALASQVELWVAAWDATVASRTTPINKPAPAMVVTTGGIKRSSLFPQ